jgi:hypothetical protein
MQVAACTSSAGPEGPVWILATVIRYDSASAMYEVEDIMEEDAMDDDTGGKIKYARRHCSKIKYPSGPR